MKVKYLTLSALFIALGIVMPFITGQIPQFGSMLLPMHLPILIAGFMLPWQYATLIGFIVPLLRSALFSMPPMFPSAFAMAFELATYALTISIIYRLFNKHNLLNTYITLIAGMIAGRVVWGIVMYLISKISFQIFLASAILNAIPGIILQLLLIPGLIVMLNKYIK